MNSDEPLHEQNQISILKACSQNWEKCEVVDNTGITIAKQFIRIYVRVVPVSTMVVSCLFPINYEILLIDFVKISKKIVQQTICFFTNFSIYYYRPLNNCRSFKQFFSPYLLLYPRWRIPRYAAT